MALTDKLSAIGDAIREKTGGTDLLTLDQMPAEIASITTGSGGEIEPIVLSGNCDYACAGNLSAKIFDKITITTNNIESMNHMFYKNPAERIPFEINIHPDIVNLMATDIFHDMNNLIELPTINGFKEFYNIYNLFNSCYRLRNIPDDFSANWDWTKLHTYQYGNISYLFTNCHSLRHIPENFLSNLWGIQYYNSNTLFYYGFNSCYVLDELIGLKTNNITYTSNSFYNAFQNCHRLKDVIFALENNAPAVRKYKNQNIELGGNMVGGLGYSISPSRITGYNSGITADKRVKDDTTYQALKDDPDYWTTDIKYSRYNHDSAVRTINSLPDTSAYLATAGGTNTIKFSGNSGALTDGGAINTLTEEEIAVATAKGWTVSLV